MLPILPRVCAPDPSIGCRGYSRKIGDTYHFFLKGEDIVGTAHGY